MNTQQFKPGDIVRICADLDPEHPLNSWVGTVLEVPAGFEPEHYPTAVPVQFPITISNQWVGLTKLADNTLPLNPAYLVPATKEELRTFVLSRELTS